MLVLKNKFFPKELADSVESLLPEAMTSLQSLVSKDCKGSEYTGWFNWPKEKGYKLLDELEQFTTGYTEIYDTIVVVGIGGSYLGTKSILDALSGRYSEVLSGMAISNKKQVLFAGHNLSEAELIELLEYLDHRNPIVNVISKSGTTTEPGVAFRLLKKYMEKRYPDSSQARILATTDGKKGALRTLSGKMGYQAFEVPDDVGGRFSVLTAVGLLPLQLAGYNVRALLKGADDFYTELLDGLKTETLGDKKAYDAIVYACHRMAAWNAGNRLEIMAYGESRMCGLIEWWKQLFGESEGKEGKGLFPVGLACTTDLHSLGQYIQEGVRNQVETFLFVGNANSKSDNGVERRLRVPDGNALDGLDYLKGTFVADINNAALLATEIAHFDGGVPCLELHLNEITEKSIGYMLAFFKTTCAVSALMLDVNPFDQPGVEAYKKNLFGIMGRPGFEEIGSNLRSRIEG